MLDDFLAVIEPHLLSDNGSLLTDFVRALRTVYTIPSKSLNSFLQGMEMSETEFESALAMIREPIPEKWLPVWKLLFKFQDTLPIQSLPEIAAAAQVWMKEASTPLRKEVGLFCLALLEKDFQKRLRDGYYDDDKFVAYSSDKGWIKDEVIRRIQAAILTGVDCIPQEVQSLLYRLLETNDTHLANLLFGREGKYNWLPVAKHLPETFVDITLKVFCDNREIKTHEFNDFYSYRFRDRTIRHDHIWDFPTDFKQDTPFYNFLNMNPNQGVKLIVQLVDFATEKWVELTRHHDKLTPLPQILTLSDGKHEFWGNHDVYNWCLSVSPHTVELALLALRHWLDEYLKSHDQEDPAKVFDFILTQSKSFAIIGVCVLVALEDINKRVSALLPILEQPAFWEIDRFRLAHMMMFGADKHLHTFRDFAPFILFTGKLEDRKRLGKALQEFPVNVPFLYEEEKSDSELVRRRLESMEELAAFGDPKNYAQQEYQGDIAIVFNYPEAIAKRHQNEERKSQPSLDLSRLQSWASSVISGKSSNQFSLTEAIALTRELDSRKFFNRESIIDVVAEVSTALVTQHYSWVRDNGYLLWCKRKIFDAIYHVNAKTRTPTPITGVLHYIVKALPALIENDPTDIEAREATWHLILHSDEYPDFPSQYLFDELSRLWRIDPDFVWQCFNLLVAKAKLIRENRQRRQEKHWKDTKILHKLEFQKRGQSARSKLIRLQLFLFYPWRKKRSRFQETNIELSAQIPTLSELDIECVYLFHPLVRAMPRLSDETNIPSDPRFLAFIDELVAFNIQVNKHSQISRESREPQLFQVPLEWEKPLYELLTSWVLHLPFEVARQHILDPIIFVWDEAFEPLEDLLNAMLLRIEEQKYEDRLIRIWKLAIPAVMESKTVQHRPQGGRNNDAKNTYSALILVDRYGFSDPWKGRAWNPAPHLTGEFSLWVKHLGHYPDNFATLVKMLRTAGKTLAVSHGIGWLFECFQRVEKKEWLFSSDRTASALAEFLTDTWLANPNLIQNVQLFQKFAFIVDYLASRGEQLAVELQRKIQK
jgi:hypothetical protein